ncbi:MAG: hypothetical protein ACPG5T_00480 [Endozoicomonas sp.]
MSGISISKPPEGMSGRKYNQIHKSSVGLGLKSHRRKNLPKHFEEEAFLLYPLAYGKHSQAQKRTKSALRKRRKKNKVQDKFNAMAARGNTAGILAFRKLISGENISELEMASIVEGGESPASYRERNSINAKRKRRGANRKNRRYQPLVNSGLLRKMALNATAKVTGPAALVSISIAGPYYLNINKGDFKKRDALTAFNQQEEKLLVKIVDQNIQKHLDKIYK